MKTWTYEQVRQKYLDFMRANGHSEIPNVSVIPENDPSVLFVNAGMFPLVPFLMGEKHPSGKKLVNVQRCIRTIDIDEVGDETHATSLEMLGNWSLNDYFKKEALNLTLDLLTEVLGIDINRIYGTVFEGDENAPRDDESIDIWKKIFEKHGIKAEVGKGERIQLYDRNDNWWELESGGPCGPSSEIFIDSGKKPCGPNCHVNCECGKFFEIGNNVFMEYLKKDGKYTDLGRHNVDFGGGLDRWATVFQGVESFYETDIYKPIMDKVKSLAKTQKDKSERIITDHIKAATWMIMDGVKPGRNEREYVLRRIIRRSIRHGKNLGIEKSFCGNVALVAIEQFKNIYPELKEKEAEITEIINEEEAKFSRTLEKGLQELEEIIKEGKEISGEKAFYLYETFGFPIEITQEIAADHNIKVSRKEFDKAFKEHKEKSRAAAKGRFKGGLAETSDATKKLHTATHLLHAALREILGDHVVQKGSNITPERLRFDFPNDRKLTEEEVKKVEDWVNDKIEKELPVTCTEMSKKEALKKVSNAMFAEKYGDTVKVYFVGNPEDPTSMELCGGPHVENTKELGKFKIKKQESVGAGVKRVKAILK